MKKYLLVLMLVVFASVPFLVNAQTSPSVADLQAQIQQLTALLAQLQNGQIAQLQAQIQTLQATLQQLTPNSVQWLQTQIQILTLQLQLIQLQQGGGGGGGGGTIPTEVSYTGASWTCYDGVGGGSGSTENSTSCKTTSQWRTEAEKSCSGHCSSVTGKCGVNSFGVTGSVCSQNSVDPGITVTYPKGGENMVSGDPLLVRWDPNIPISIIEIVSRDGYYSMGIYGSKYGNISPITTGEFRYVLPNNIPADVYYVRVTPVNNGVQATSRTFSINQINQPSITVLSPNGGETWVKNTTQMIKWQDNGPMPSCTSSTGSVSPNCIGYARYYDIRLVTHYPPCTGQVCPAYPYLAPYTIAKGVNGSSYSWTVGKMMDSYNALTPDGSYVVQVCQAGTNICDSSNSYFKVVGNQPITGVVLSVSTDKSQYTSDEAIAVYFKAYNNSKEPVTLKFTSGCQTAYSIAYYDSTSNQACTANTSEVIIKPQSPYYWEVKHSPLQYKIPAGQYKLEGRILASNYSLSGVVPYGITVTDSTTQQPSITITSPNGGEQLNTGNVIPVRWTSSNLPTNKLLDIWLLDNPTRLGSQVLTGVPNTGSANWVVSPLGMMTDKNGQLVTPSGKYVMFINCSDNNCTVDDSNDSFTIPTPVPTPANGSCGSANGVSVSTTPSSGLCTSGTASTVTGSGPYTWSCAGSNGGSAASCSASKTAVVTKSLTFTAPTAGSAVTAGVSMPVTWDSTGYDNTGVNGQLYLYTAAGSQVSAPYTQYATQNSWNLYLKPGSFNPTLKATVLAGQSTGQYKFILISNSGGERYESGVFTVNASGQSRTDQINQMASVLQVIQDMLNALTR